MYSRIIVAVDSSHASNRALDEAIKIAKDSGATLRILHVLDDLSVSLATNPYAGYYSGALIENLRQSGAKVLEEARTRAAAAELQVETVLYDDLGLPVEERILTAAQNWPADLIVMGTHGRRGVKRAMLGSSAEAVLRASPIPVLLVRTP
ncbi:universal stress protein [Achromobacter marplatensis]|uniref:Universal stress protein n=1 Tax=Achromobacter marplatensis TaxID=470868 RepID=A0AA42WB62_9BURK|nr:universal stress protein [Achromobacter marplatensis]MDH2052063.1 universal stress protein [Achromobacter marplatensis]